MMRLKSTAWPEALQHCHCRITYRAAAAMRIEEIKLFKAKITNNHPFSSVLVHKMILIFRNFNSVKIYHIIKRWAGEGDTEKNIKIV